MAAHLTMREIQQGLARMAAEAAVHEKTRPQQHVKHVFSNNHEHVKHVQPSVNPLTPLDFTGSPLPKPKEHVEKSEQPTERPGGKFLFHLVNTDPALLKPQEWGLNQDVVFACCRDYGINLVKEAVRATEATPNVGNPAAYCLGAIRRKAKANGFKIGPVKNTKGGSF